MSKQTTAAPRGRRLKARDAIFQTMIRMLRENSFADLTVRNIAEEAGVSVGTFYHYFKGKDELLAFYLHTAFDGAEVKKRLPEGGDILREILAVYDIYLGYCADAGVEYMSSYYNSRNPYINTRKRLGQSDVIQDQVARLVLELLETAGEQGYLSAPPEEITNDICVVAKGVILDWCLNNGESDIKDYMRKMLTIYINSVLTPAYRRHFQRPAAGTTPEQAASGRPSHEGG